MGTTELLKNVLQAAPAVVSAGVALAILGIPLIKEHANSKKYRWGRTLLTFALLLVVAGAAGQIYSVIDKGLTVPPPGPGSDPRITEMYRRIAVLEADKKPVLRSGYSVGGQGGKDRRGFFILGDTQICFGTRDADPIADQPYNRSFAFAFDPPFESPPSVTVTASSATPGYTFGIFDDGDGPTPSGLSGRLTEASREYTTATKEALNHLKDFRVRVSYIAVGKPKNGQ
jgi:hypothetical protein